MADSNRPAEAAPPAKTTKESLRYTPAGSVLLASDFLISVPIGAVLGFLVGQIDKIGDTAPTILLAYVAALVALAAIVIAAHTLLITLLSPEYLVLLEHAKGGVPAVSRPYKIVAFVCAAGSLASLTAALVWPVLPNGYSTTRGLVFGVCTLFASWGILGSTQLIGLGAFHLERRTSLLHIVRDVRQLREQNRKQA
ncbi:hypothetical protein [Kribbella sp. NPDC051137]|uniref:hypothetical protein n=1 Tax=Kribbella sp. NPDC051137 TaxID=3155045 RepID=UPI003422AC7B